MRTPRINRWLAGIFLAEIFCYASTATTLVVDGNGTNVVTACTEPALREAMARGGVVRFGCDGTINVANTIEVTNSVELDGSGYSVAISGSNSVRIFRVATNVTFSLANLALVNGKFSAQQLQDGSGGALYNDGGNVRLVSCVLSNNSAIGYSGATGTLARGGCIFSRNGTLLLDGVLAISNSVTGGFGFQPLPWGQGTHSFGGAVSIQGGSASVTGSRFVGNRAMCPIGSAASGGALGSEDASLRVTESLFGGNSATGQSATYPPNAGGGSVSGGALWVSGTGVVSWCEFRANIATAGNGFGQFGSAGSAQGGAVYNLGVLDVRDSTFSGNTVVAGGGGPSGDGAGDGGGLWNARTSFINGTTFDRNIARSGYLAGGAMSGNRPGSGGGIFNAGTLFATNCTLALNRAEAVINGDALGGGLYNSAGAATLMNVTVAANVAVVHSSLASGANLSSVDNGTLSLRNSLVAYSTGLSNNTPVSSSNAYGTITDNGFNMSSDGSCNFNSGSSFNFIDPGLDALADNGGPTFTMRLVATSPAIDFGSPVGAPAFDQRGARRPYGLGVDIGAYEDGPPAPILTVERNDSLVNLSFFAQAGVSYQLGYSTNLVSWQLQEAIAAAATNRVISRSVPITGARRFFRVQ